MWLRSLVLAIPLFGAVGCCAYRKASADSCYRVASLPDGGRTVMVFSPNTGLLSSVYSVPSTATGLGSSVDRAVGQHLAFDGATGLLIGRGYYDGEGRFEGSVEQWDSSTGSMRSIRHYKAGVEVGHSLVFVDGKVQLLRAYGKDGAVVAELDAASLQKALSKRKRRPEEDTVVDP